MVNMKWECVQQVYGHTHFVGNDAKNSNDAKSATFCIITILYRSCITSADFSAPAKPEKAQFTERK